MFYRRQISRRLVLAASLLALPGNPEAEAPPVEAPVLPDPRELRIYEYFQQRDCPAQHFAADFVEAADRHELDWRLLPSLSMVESTGGKHARNNNMFGWDSCKTGFTSIRAGIHVVAERLQKSHYYRDKGLEDVLRTYNPRRNYPPRVRAVMRQLGPANLEPSATW